MASPPARRLPQQTLALPSLLLACNAACDAGISAEPVPDEIIQLQLEHLLVVHVRDQQRQPMQLLLDLVDALTELRDFLLLLAGDVICREQHVAAVPMGVDS